jgi:hypothetical protein
LSRPGCRSCEPTQTFEIPGDSGHDEEKTVASHQPNVVASLMDEALAVRADPAPVSVGVLVLGDRAAAHIGVALAGRGSGWAMVERSAGDAIPSG